MSVLQLIMHHRQQMVSKTVADGTDGTDGTGGNSEPLIENIRKSKSKKYNLVSLDISTSIQNNSI